ncbi:MULTISPECIES: DinB family protein [Niallia]|uniref:Damage-inducible protein DinB n=1 Tax=Niallia circulans TaxID=1397 RepID=A0A268FIH5_NIACI|nr:DinB family protein [Niallia circulans]AYV66236.1 DinB family protein [Niallia circulans]AYV70945.1 DinB family protein [Niallia circulans]NRG30088.1 DinB family protein [Niallia circulans]PAD85182.1 damage-inducible protein DinB [Niallia circulans]QJX62120.1 DinB family protein [Niallia circulans]
MNTYIGSALNQIEIALKTTIEMVETIEEADLQQRPDDNKRSIGELLEHIAVICKADLLISNGATQKEMDEYYSSVALLNMQDIKNAIADNYKTLKDIYMNLTEIELQERTTSYWGVTYSRYEWLLEIVAHIYHHRAQLHTLLVYCCGKDLNISLFE